MKGGDTIAKEIERLIVRLDGASVCDDCIADRLDLPARNQVYVVTRALGGQRGFERQNDPCVLCGASKTVIRCRAK
jgi:hypothetical protein